MVGSKEIRRGCWAGANDFTERSGTGSGFFERLMKVKQVRTRIDVRSVRPKGGVLSATYVCSAIGQQNCGATQEQRPYSWSL